MNKSEELSQLASQAEELVTNLKTLTERIGHYGAAKDDLKNASQALVQLSGELEELTSQSKAILVKLDQLKTAELSAQLSSVSDKLEAGVQESRAAISEIAARQKKILFVGISTIMLLLVSILLIVKLS